MSIRAYRQITETVLASEPTFNLWREQEVLDSLLDLEDTWSTEGNEQIEVSVRQLEKLLKKAQFDPLTMKALQADIAAAKADKSEVVTYFCY